MLDRIDDGKFLVSDHKIFAQRDYAAQEIRKGIAELEDRRDRARNSDTRLKLTEQAEQLREQLREYADSITAITVLNPEWVAGRVEAQAEGYHNDAILKAEDILNCVKGYSFLNPRTLSELEHNTAMRRQAGVLAAQFRGIIAQADMTTIEGARQALRKMKALIDNQIEQSASLSTSPIEGTRREANQFLTYIYRENQNSWWRTTLEGWAK